VVFKADFFGPDILPIAQTTASEQWRFKQFGWRYSYSLFSEQFQGETTEAERSLGWVSLWTL